MMSDTETLWEKPIAVFGYNDAIDLFGGWLFEAETNCIEEHNMGQVASSGTVYIRTVKYLLSIFGTFDSFMVGLRRNFDFRINIPEKKSKFYK